MRLLVVPLLYWTYRFMGISCVNRLLDLSHAMLALEPELNITFAVPDRGHEPRWQYNEGDVHRGNPRLQIRYWPLGNTFYDSMSLSASTLRTLNCRSSPDMMFDMILNSHAWLSVTMKRSTQIGIPLCDVPIVTYQNGSPTDWKSGYYVMEKNGAFQRGEYLGNMMVDGCVYLSESDRTHTMREARRFVSAAITSHMMNRTLVLRPTVEPALFPFEEMMQKREAREIPALFYGGTFHGRKCVKDMAEIKGQIDAMHECDLVVSTQMDKYPAYLDDAGAKVFVKMPRDKYYELLALGDVALVMDDDAVNTVWQIEALAAGLIPIWWRKVLREDESLWEDWPYIFNSKGDAPAMVMAVLRNLPKARERMRRLRRKLLPVFSARKQAADLMTFLRARNKEARRERFSTGSYAALMEDAVAGRDVLTLTEVYDGMKRKSRGGVDFRQRRDLLSPWEVRQYVLAAGFADTGASDEICFRRET